MAPRLDERLRQVPDRMRFEQRQRLVQTRTTLPHFSSTRKNWARSDGACALLGPCSANMMYFVALREAQALQHARAVEVRLVPSEVAAFTHAEL